MALIKSNSNRTNGLVKASPTADIPVPVRTQAIAAPEYKGVAVDTRWINRSNLLTHVEGSSWVVTYYGQVLDSDSQLSGNQINVSGVYQQYRKINGLELKVQAALSTQQDEETKSMEMRGTAIVYPFMIPNEGDMFVADIGEGQTAVFRVTLTTKKSIFKEACYEIAYVLDTDQADKKEDLENKVVSTVFFEKDFMNLGKNPLLLTAEHATLLDVRGVYSVLAEQYFQRWFSNEYKTLLVPGQSQSTYDPFLVSFLLSQFDTTDSQEIRYIRALNVQGNPAMKCHNLWTALKERNPAYLQSAFHKVGRVSTRIFSCDPTHHNIRFTGIQRSTYPMDAQLTVSNQLQHSPSPVLVEPLEQTYDNVGLLYTMVQAVNLANLDPSDGTIKPVVVDDYYVLSEAFYKDTAGQSTLEGVVWNYLRGEPMDAQALVATARLWPQWGQLEQFYYVPILMAMLKSILLGG